MPGDLVLRLTLLRVSECRGEVSDGPEKFTMPAIEWVFYSWHSFVVPCCHHQHQANSGCCCRQHCSGI